MDDLETFFHRYTPGESLRLHGLNGTDYSCTAIVDYGDLSGEVVNDSMVTSEKALQDVDSDFRIVPMAFSCQRSSSSEVSGTVTDCLGAP